VTRTRAELDLLRQTDVERFFASERPDVVFLAAARVGGIMANMTRGAAFLYENLEIQNNVMRAASTNGTGKFIFLGSSCIYPRDCPQPIKEEYFLTGPFEPTNEGYAIAKIAGMKLCGYLAAQGAWEGISVIPCNIYGPGDNFDPFSSHVAASLVGKFTDAAEAGAKSVTCWGTGTPRREFLHADDLARGIMMLADNNPYGGEPVNIGYGSDMTIRELAETIADAAGFEGEIAWDPSKPDGMPRKLMDSARARAIGFEPRIAPKEGLRKLIEHYRTLPGRQRR
jgi:GDP-L-fucose synthase